MQKLLIVFLLLVLTTAGFTQTLEKPTDFLTSDFHKDRRTKLREMLSENSVAVFFANPIRNRANDVDYVYHQDPDFYYLTGYKEPNAVLLLFKDVQNTAEGKEYTEIIFVQPRNAVREMWTGRRLGDIQTQQMLGLQVALNNSEFKNYAIDFSKFSKVLFFEFQNDVRNDTDDKSDLYDLIEVFKKASGYQQSLEATALNPEPKPNNLNMKDLAGMMDKLRGIKTPAEIEMIRKAVRISCQGQVEVMKAMRPGLSEREIQGIHEFVFKKYQAEDLGYPSIVGGGHNGCILHYIDNYKPAITNKELVLMDLGAEYHGYTADITRTIPSSGNFSKEQKQIYDLVLKAQEEAMKVTKAGVPFSDLYRATARIINTGLKDLGIIASETERHSYYPHGCCHHIGLDVHDRGEYTVLQENMVITIEPGIYIPENAKCDKKWWGIAVRIEDDYLITKEGYEHLSVSAPRTTDAIEAMMKLPSPLDNLNLPPIDGKKQ